MRIQLHERTAILDIELSDWLDGSAPPCLPLDTAVGDYGSGAGGAATAALVLVRLHGRPVGYVTVPVLGASVMRDTVLAALIQRHLDEVGAALASTAIDTLGLHGPDVPALLRHPPAAPPRAAEDRPLVTVAVCTRNRPADLDRCLAALTRLRYTPLDLLVVDNAPTDSRTAAVVRRYPQVRYGVEPRPGLDWARNCAIAECRGAILAFTDDDVVVDPGWVDGLVAAFGSDPTVMAVTGLVLPVELDSPSQRLFEIYGGFARGVRRRWFRARPGRPAALELGGAGAFGTGANMAYRRRVFAHIGGFDPALDVGTPANGGGDLEMFFRVLKHGHALVYEPTAVVWHRHRDDAAALQAQITNNGIGFYAYLARTAAAYPDERLPVLRLGLWWFAWWSLRRLVLRLLGRETVPLALIAGELGGSLRGPFRYVRARMHAARVSRTYPGARTVPAAPSVPPPAEVLTREAVRQVDVTQPLHPLVGLSAYRRVRVFVFRGGQLIGRVIIDNRGADVSAAQLRDTITGTLPLATLGGPFAHPDPERARSRLATALRAAFVPASAANRGAIDVPGDARTGTRPDAPLPLSVPVSIVVATFDRPDDLRACLTSLTAQQTPRRVELIVVDNHPDSGITPPVVRDFPGVRLVSEARGGLSYARNRGIVEASGAIILTTDDDVVCPPDWVENLIRPFARPEVMIVTGNVLPMALETEAEQLFESYGGLGRGFQPLEAHPGWFGTHRRSVPTWRLGCTANAAFRASIFDDPRIGLMDEALGAGTPTGCSEDTYLFYRVLAAGFALVYEPGAYVWHRHRSTIAALQRQLYSYSKGHVAYHLTTWLVDGDRRGLLRILLELPATYLQRTVLRLTRRSDYPLRFIGIEILGSLAGPWALWHSRRRVRRLGRSRPASMSIPLTAGSAVSPDV